MTNILITDGENRSSLAATRSLGRKGCRVVVTGKSDRCLASSSKFSAKGIAVPDPEQNSEKYTWEVLDIVGKENIDFVLPMTEVSIHLLNKVRDKFPSGSILACASSEKMFQVSDKFSLFQLAEKLNVPVPNTYYLSSQKDLSGIIQDIDSYPVVVKPALSSTPLKDGFLSGGVMYASSQEELQYLYETKDTLQYPSLIQERIHGPGTGLFTLYDGDKHLALFSHRRLREKPPSGGVSVVSESVPLDEEMVVSADQLLSNVGWHGVAMVEFKRDLRDGKAKLMEINGRFWGTLQLAISCGVDFPALFLDQLQGRKPSDPVKDYKIGHKMKWFFGTLDHLLIRLKNNDAKLSLPPQSPSKWKSILEFMKIWETNSSFDVFDRKDPGPFWLEARQYIHQILRG